MSIPSDERNASEEVAYSDPVFFEGSYDDLLRHEDEHKGKVVYVSGTVQIVNESNKGYDLQVWSTSSLQMDTQFSLYSNYPDRLLSGDSVSGYGIYYGICAENRIGDPITCFTNVKLETIDFRTASDDLCDDPIAKQFGLC